MCILKNDHKPPLPVFSFDFRTTYQSYLPGPLADLSLHLVKL